MSESLPDFYLVGGHGVGLQSMIYYLAYLGLPTDAWWGWNESHDKKISHTYPLAKNTNLYARGVTCDHALPQPLRYGKGQQKILWLIRDPVALLCSYINQCIGDNLNPFSKNTCLGLNELTMDKFLHSDKFYYCMYSSQLRSVAARGEIMPIDTTDLLPDFCEKTMEYITKMFNQSMPTGIKDIFKTSYNSFYSRLFYNIPPTTLYRDYGTIQIYTCKALLYDFHFNFWQRAFFLGEYRWQRERWNIFSKTPLPDGFTLLPEEQKAIVRNIGIVSAYHASAISLYERHAISKEELVDWLRHHKRHYRELLHLLVDELTLVQRLAADKLAGWTSLHQLIG